MDAGVASSGAAGELIERLIEAIDHAPDEHPDWWADLGLVVAVMLGGIETVP